MNILKVNAYNFDSTYVAVSNVITFVLICQKTKL